MPEVIREAPDKLSDQLWRFDAYSRRSGTGSSVAP